MKQRLLRTAATVLLLTAAVAAQPKTFTLDPARSMVDYTVAGNFHTVHGTFRFRSGVITFDPSTGAASGTLVVDAASGDSGSQARDHRMKRDILKTDKYPEVILTVERVEGALPATGKSSMTIHGRMMLNGVAHPISFPAEIDFTGQDARATAEITIPYVAWGLKNPSTFIFRVHDEVVMHVTVVGRLSAAAAVQ